MITVPTMNEKILLQQGNNLQIKFDINHQEESKFLSETSKEYICGAVYFQLQAYSARCKNNQSYPDYVTIISVRFTKLFKYDNLKYICKFSSVELGDVNTKLTEANIWHQIFHHNQVNKNGHGLFTFVVSFQSDIAPSAVGPFATIYDDDESTDFKLCGKDGSVKVHKLALKYSSPVLQGMLNGEWKESSEGKITLEDVSKVTCEHFKDYIYLDILPNINIEHLLILGSYFMMPDLVQKCCVKLLNKLDADNIMELIGFACNYKVTNLFVAIIKIIRKGLVNIDNFYEDNLFDMCRATNATLNIKK